MVTVSIKELHWSGASRDDIADILDTAYDTLGANYASGTVTLVDAWTVPETPDSPNVIALSLSGYGLDPITLDSHHRREERLEQLQQALDAAFSERRIKVVQLDKQRSEYAGLKDFSGWDEVSADKQARLLETVSHRLGDDARKTARVLADYHIPLQGTTEHKQAAVEQIADNIRQSLFGTLTAPFPDAKLPYIAEWLLTLAEDAKVQTCVFHNHMA